MYSPAYPQQDNDSSFPWAGAGATAVGLGALAATPFGFRSALGLSHGVKALPGGGPVGGLIEGGAKAANNLGESGASVAANVRQGLGEGFARGGDILTKKARDRLNKNVDELGEILKNPARPGLRPPDVIKRDLKYVLKSDLLSPEEKLDAMQRLKDMVTSWYSMQPARFQKTNPLDFTEYDASMAKIASKKSGPSLRDSLP